MLEERAVFYKASEEGSLFCEVGDGNVKPLYIAIDR